MILPLIAICSWLVALALFVILRARATGLHLVPQRHSHPQTLSFGSRR